VGWVVGQRSGTTVVLEVVGERERGGGTCVDAEAATLAEEQGRETWL
jgi:hypothetical protein